MDFNQSFKDIVKNVGRHDSLFRRNLGCVHFCRRSMECEQRYTSYWLNIICIFLCVRALLLNYEYADEFNIVVTILFQQTNKNEKENEKMRVEIIVLSEF